jgi:nicotinate phosphoribosyltransferase
MNKVGLYTPRDFFAHAREESEIGSLLNNDMYKFLMLDFILAHPEYKDINVQREMKIRSKDVRTKEVIPLEAFKEQLDYCKHMQGVSDADLSYLRGMTNDKNGAKPLFREETLQFLKTFRLPEYQIGDDGQNYSLKFTGPWSTSTMWEIFGLKILNSLYAYYYTKKAKLTHSEFTSIISQSLVRLFDDIKTFKQDPDLRFMEFGARRSLSTDYHRLIFTILSESLPTQCVGTSNVLFSREMGLNNPKGTNAHELRMIPTALYDDPQKIIDTMYEIDRQRIQHHPGLGILLPDTYGSSFYFKNCPEDIALHHNGNRFDSKDPMVGIPEYLEFLKKYGRDPKKMVGIPSDGLDARSAVGISSQFKHDLNLSFGIGTSLSNNTKGTWPRAQEEFGPFGSFSVVVKPTYAQRPDGIWVPCVKLSDNPGKAMGGERAEYFKQIFGAEGVQEQTLIV